MRMEETWTILRVLQWTTGHFKRKGVEQPRANAEVLLAHVLEMERIGLYLHYDKPLGKTELARYRECVRRRTAREPSQYITGKQEFWSLEFEVTPAVLIPRPETEILVERAAALLKNANATVLDLGTGSGVIAVALAHECPSLRIVATDRSPEALAVAKRNSMRHGVEERIHFAAMDLFSGFSITACPFDLIVSNPPYVSDTDFANLPPEIARYEPESALRGEGPEGLGTIRRILEKARNLLKKDGHLFIEIGCGHAGILRKAAAADFGMRCMEFIKDYSDIFRVLHAWDPIG